MRCHISLVVLAGFYLSGAVAQAQQFVPRVFQDEAGAHKYTVFVPAGYSPSKRWPTILFLHGAGERGTDGIKPTLVGLGPYAKARGSSFPFLVVFPQVEDTHGRITTAWQAGEPAGERALKILDDVQRTFAVDPQRISLVGWSMGGYGAWSLGAAYPERWSAVVPISGGGNPETIASLKNTPVWAFHGVGDRLVPVDQTRAMVEALRDAGGNVAYNELTEGLHDVSEQVFSNDGFFAWLLDPRRAPAQLSPASRRLNVEPPPFIPALEVPQSVGIRLGNDALRALSYAAPQLIPPGMLTGRLNDMYDSTTASGRSFSVTFSGISYTGQLDRVMIQATGANRVTLQLGIRNVVLNIAATSVMGARHSAYAGPINIGIGHNGPVWLNIDVAPVVENRRLRLRTLGASFSIPPSNYYVTPPAGVSTRGWGMTEQRVTSSLVSGLYGARTRVENEVRAIVPNIVQQFEQQFQLADAGPIVAGMWPLPVYEPRLRAVPEYVTTDANGISILLSIAAAAPDLSASRGEVLRAQPAGITPQALGSDRSLSVAVAPQVLSPLTQLLINADLAQIDLLDIPEPALHRLADRKVLEEILPDLKRFDDTTETRAMLALAAPLQVQRTQANGVHTEAVPLEFQLPQVQIHVATRPKGERQWQPYAIFTLRVHEQVLAQLEKPSHERRMIELNWTDARSIDGEGAFAANVQPQDSTIHVDRLVELFKEGWEQWTSRGPAGASTVPDVQFATTKLRISDLHAAGDALAAEFTVPTVKLTNQSEEQFVYETKGPYSGWGGPYTLEPGKSHEYDIPYPLTYRRRGPAGTEVYTLYPGSHSEFYSPKSGGPPRLFQAAK